MKTKTVRIRGLDIRRYCRAISLAEQTLRPDTKGAAQVKHDASFAVAICVLHKRVASMYDAEGLAGVEDTAQRYVDMLDESKKQQKLPALLSPSPLSPREVAGG